MRAFRNLISGSLGPGAVACLLMLCASAAGAQSTDNPAETIRQLAAKDPYEALDRARQLQLNYPGDEALLIELIKLEARHQNLPALREAVRSAMGPRMVKDYGPPEPVWYAVAGEWAKGGDWEDLEGAATEVLKRYPGYFQAKHDMVRAKVMKGDFSGAVLDMEQFPFPPPTHLEAKPGTAVARIPAFMLYLAAGELPAALKAIPDPNARENWEWRSESLALRAWATPAKERATILEASGRSDIYGPLTPPLPLHEMTAYIQPTHERLWKEIARRYPDCFPAALYSGVWAGAGGRPAEAEKLVRQAAQMQPDWALPHRLLGFHYYKRKDYWRAQSELERASELLGYWHWNNVGDPTPRPKQQLDDARNYLAGAETASRGKLKEADKLLARVIAYPYQQPAIRLRGAILAALGNEHYARQLLETYTWNSLLPRQSLEQYTGDQELFPSPPSGRLEPGQRPKPVEFRLQLVRWIGSSRRGSLIGIGDAEIHRTADCVEILLRSAAHDGKDQTARLWYGMWLLRSDEMWPAGDPRQTDPKRIRDGKKLLEGVLKENPGQARAAEALQRLAERGKSTER